MTEVIKELLTQVGFEIKSIIPTFGGPIRTTVRGFRVVNKVSFDGWAILSLSHARIELLPCRVSRWQLPNVYCTETNQNSVQS